MNSRTKGKRGELEWSHFLNDAFGLSARRGQQYKGSPESPDVAGGFEGTHCEVKRVERLNVDDAMDQAVADSGDDIPYVAHRKNRRDWLITVRAVDLAAFSDAVVTTMSR